MAKKIKAENNDNKKAASHAMAQLSTEKLADKFKEQFKATDDEIKPFADLKENHIYETLKAKNINTKYGDKYILTIRDIDDQDILIKVFAPNSYVNKCKYRKVNISNKHFFMYKGDEEKTHKETGETYKFHNVDLIKELDGYNGTDINIESDEEEF